MRFAWQTCRLRASLPMTPIAPEILAPILVGHGLRGVDAFQQAAGQAVASGVLGQRLPAEARGA